MKRFKDITQRLLYFNKEFKDMNAIERACIELRIGRISSLPVLYEAAFSSLKYDSSLAAHEITKYMEVLNYKQIISLNDSFRISSYWNCNIDWRNVDLDKLINDVGLYSYLWMLRLGTFHSNGYFRQKCIEKLAYVDKTNDYLCFIVLRLNDWVSEVRSAAFKACEKINDLSVDETIGLLPYIDKIDGGLRKNEVEFNHIRNMIYISICDHFDEIDLIKLSHYDEKTRESLYKIMLKYKLVNAEQILSFIKKEKSSHCQDVLLDLYFQHYNYSLEDLDLLLACKSKLVQRKTLEKKYSIVGEYWPGVEELLLSDASGVREMVRYILRKHTDIDGRTYYLDRLESEYKRVCIVGIGEYGSKNDADILLPYIDDQDTVIGKATLHSISKLLGADASELLYSRLFDERPVIMRSACREIAKNNIKLGSKRVYELIVHTNSRYLREKMIYSLVRENSWERLPYLLMLYWYEDEYLRLLIQDAATKRGTYGRVDNTYASEIRSIMNDERYNIPQMIKEQIEFDLKYVIKS